jgi:glucosyl-dolichyl phosphate glucuronosyltransferase
MDVSVVLCTYNRARMLRRAIDGLAAMHVPPDLAWDLIVVDNNSSDDTAAVVRDAAARVAFPCRYLFEGRQGKTFALNRGIGAATGEIVALVDDDEIVHADWIAAVRRAFAAHGCAGIGGRIVPVWSHPKPTWYADTAPCDMSAVLTRYDHGDAPGPVPDAPYGGNMAFRRSAFETYGMFDTRLGRVGTRLTCAEDTEFGDRLLLAGEALFYVPDAIVYQPVAPERLRRAYFESWYYHAGRSSVYAERGALGAPRWLGAPRYLFREVVEQGLRALTARDGRRRFYHKLSFLRHLGQITGHCEEALRARVTRRTAARGAA